MFASLLLACLLWSATAGATSATPAATASTELFTGPELAIPQQERPQNPTTTHWRVQFYLRPVAGSSSGTIKVLLPLSSEHQEILTRRNHLSGFRGAEWVAGTNLLGVYFPDATSSSPEIRLDWEVAVRDSIAEVPEVPFPLKIADSNDPLLSASELIQSNDPALRKLARELTTNARTARAAIWSLFQFTVNSIEASSGGTREDALAVLRRGKGTMTGRARLLTALLRAAGIPAEIAGGLRLEDAAKKRATIAWVEAKIGDVWVPLDPTGGHFGWIPNRYLALYRGDLPLIVYPAGMEFEYGFLVQRTRLQPARRDRAGKRKDFVVPARPLARTLSSSVEDPVASVVLITDQNPAPETIERIFREATNAGVDVVLFTVPQAPRYFRQQYLQRLLANNLHIVQAAHVLVLHTADDAGLFASLVLGEVGIKMGDARVVVAGAFSRPVGTVLGAVLYKLLDAGEIVLLNQPVKLPVLWSLVRGNLLDGVPFAEEAARWGIQPTVVDSLLFESLGRWRHLVVDGWARAVVAQVPLQALTFILVLPVIAALVVLVRTLIGLETFGVFAPVIVSLAFLTTGLLWGLVIFVTIVGAGAGVRPILQTVRLQLVSRLAILITIVAGIMAGLAVLGASFGVGALLNVSIFPMVIMSNMIEHFASSRAQFGTRTALRLTGNTLLMASLCYASVEWAGLQSLLLAFPEILLVAVAVDLILGRWRGLRLLEYARFWPIVQQEKSGP